MAFLLILRPEIQSDEMKDKNPAGAIHGVFLLCLMFVVIHPAFGQRLRGKIKAFSESCYEVKENFGRIRKGAKLDDPGFRDQVVRFDSAGNVTEAVEYNPDGTIFCRFAGREGLRDNNTESLYLSFYPEKTIERKPFIIHSVSYSTGELCEMTYEPGPDGLAVVETIRDFLGRVLCTIHIKRDEDGNPVEYSFADGRTDHLKYDGDGNRTEWISTSSGGSTVVTTCKYDLNGNVVEMNPDNLYKSTYHFLYDGYTYAYRFDKHGNWVERVDYNNGIPKRLVARKIEYSQ
jgi:YD repeat-containing protein